MQGRFIGTLKENFKAIKQEIKGADIFSEKLNFPKSQVNESLFIITNEICEKEFIINTKINEKKFDIETMVYTLDKSNINTTIKKYNFEMNIDIKKYNFEKNEYIIKDKKLEKIVSIVNNRVIEVNKKILIKDAYLNKFKIKFHDGTDKIRKIPVVIEGRRFISNKELLDLAIKIKSQNKELDFTKYNFKTVFENLSVDLIDDYQYIDDTVELKIYYKKYTKNKSLKKKLVILVEKNSLNTEKIFI